MEKIKTGVVGLDDMLGGGLIKGRPYLLMGGPGAGKTILGMQFLMEGIKNGEKGLYMALEESTDQLRNNMATLGWDVSGVKMMDTTQELGSDKWFIKSDSVVSRPEFTIINLMKVLREKMVAYKPKRIVIDSITSIRLLYEREYDVRKVLLALMNFLLKSETTCLLTSEVDHQPGMATVEEFITSGVIKLHRIDNKGDVINAISISKMRGSDFDRHVRPMKIMENGISVFSNESIF